MDKFDTLREVGTDGANYDLNTEAMIAHLKVWDTQYGITVSDVKSDAVVVRFDRLPDDTLPLAGDIYAFCPDTIDQGFGVYKDMAEDYKAEGDALPEEMAELVKGVDFEDENFGLVLLSRSLSLHKVVALWWD